MNVYDKFFTKNSQNNIYNIYNILQKITIYNKFIL